MIDQYTVDNYRIDLYFPKHKLAIECDEFDHADRDIEYEVKRQNHHQHHEVINRIIRAIYL